MNKEFVPYAEALALKELGFNEPCFGYFENQDMNLVINFNNLPLTEEQSKRPGLHIIDNRNSVLPQWATAAPLFQQAFRFFREKYKIRFFIQSGMSDLGEFFKVIFPDGEQRTFSYETREEAELACLRKLIEIVKKK